jgi:hypothetical protein
MPLRSNIRPGNTFRGINLRSQQQSPRPGLVVSESDPHSTLVGGSLLLQKGLGQTYSSIDDYEHSTGRNISGSGLGGLSQVAQKLKELKKEPLKRKPKNIRFTL